MLKGLQRRLHEPIAAMEEESISPEQLAQTLENMCKAWEALPEEQRLPKDEEKSFFDNGRHTCAEIISRWHSGQSSHVDKEELARIYSNDEEGCKLLWEHMRKIKDDPFVQAADLQLRMTKYKGGSR